MCIRGLAGRGGAVVAAETGAEHGGMVDLQNCAPRWSCCDSPQHTAVVWMWAVCLHGGGGAVVTTAEITGDGAVIERRRRPGIGGVAVIAGGAAGNVIGVLPVAVVPLWQLKQVPSTAA